MLLRPVLLTAEHWMIGVEVQVPAVDFDEVDHDFDVAVGNTLKQESRVVEPRVSGTDLWIEHGRPIGIADMPGPLVDCQELLHSA